MLPANLPMNVYDVENIEPRSLKNKKRNILIVLPFTLIILTTLVLLNGCKEEKLDQPKEEDLKEVSAEVLFFEFIPDSGNNAFRLLYEIKFTNPNNVAVNGFYEITTLTDGLQTAKLSSNNSPCYRIEARSDCAFTFDEEDSFDLGRINTIELVSVKYNIEG